MQRPGGASTACVPVLFGMLHPGSIEGFHGKRLDLAPGRTSVTQINHLCFWDALRGSCCITQLPVLRGIAVRKCFGNCMAAGKNTETFKMAASNNITFYKEGWFSLNEALSCRIA